MAQTCVGKNSLLKNYPLYGMTSVVNISNHLLINLIFTVTMRINAEVSSGRSRSTCCLFLFTDLDMAIAYWNIVLKGRFKFLELWCKFLQVSLAQLICSANRGTEIM